MTYSLIYIMFSMIQFYIPHTSPSFDPPLKVTSAKLVLLVYQWTAAVNIIELNNNFILWILIFILIIFENPLSRAIRDNAKTQKCPPKFCYPCKRMPLFITIVTIFHRLIHLFISKAIFGSHSRGSYFSLTSFFINQCMWMLPTIIARHFLNTPLLMLLIWSNLYHSTWGQKKLNGFKIYENHHWTDHIHNVVLNITWRFAMSYMLYIFISTTFIIGPKMSWSLQR